MADSTQSQIAAYLNTLRKVEADRNTKAIEDSREQEYIKSLQLDNNYKSIQNSLLQQQIDWANDDRQARKIYGRGILAFCGTYVVIVLIISIIYICYSPQQISEKIIITLLTTTSLNIAGAAAIVIRYLFPPQANNSHKNP